MLDISAQQLDVVEIFGFFGPEIEFSRLDHDDQLIFS